MKVQYLRGLGAFSPYVVTIKISLNPNSLLNMWSDICDEFEKDNVPQFHHSHMLIQKRLEVNVITIMFLQSYIRPQSTIYYSTPNGSLDGEYKVRE